MYRLPQAEVTVVNRAREACATLCAIMALPELLPESEEYDMIFLDTGKAQCDSVWQE